MNECCLNQQEKELEAERQKKQNVLEMDPVKLRKIAERKRKRLEKQKEKQALLAAANAGNDNDGTGNENGGFSDGEKQIGVPLQSNLTTANLENTDDNVSRFSEVRSVFFKYPIQSHQSLQ